MTKRKATRGGISTGAIAAIIVVLVLVTTVVLDIYVTVPPGSKGTTSSTTTGNSSEVRVFGLVSAIGAGTRPVELVFSDAQSGQATSAPISEGRYSVQLPNHRTYNVSMKWLGNYTWQTGYETLGQIVCELQEGSMMAQSYNVVHATPDSQVIVNGTLNWQMVTSYPAAIKFTAANGQSFITTVNGKAFSIRLPNMMTYEVNVQAKNATGSTDWYYFHQLKVSADINVVAITVRLGQ